MSPLSLKMAAARVGPMPGIIVKWRSSFSKRFASASSSLESCCSQQNEFAQAIGIFGSDKHLGHSQSQKKSPRQVEFVPLFLFLTDFRKYPIQKTDNLTLYIRNGVCQTKSRTTELPKFDYVFISQLCGKETTKPEDFYNVKASLASFLV